MNLFQEIVLHQYYLFVHFNQSRCQTRCLSGAKARRNWASRRSSPVTTLISTKPRFSTSYLSLEQGIEVASIVVM